MKWDKLQIIYKAYDIVKREKIQTYRCVFEILTMKEYEILATYFLHIDEVVNILRGHGEIVPE